MIDLARPGFLWAGALLALGPLLMHLLRPVERSRKQLPTSRFLTADPKRRVRLHRTPDERILLLLRMLLCLLIGAAFAGVGWVGAERGVATLVVVDGGGTMRDGWVDARALLTGPPTDGDAQIVIVRPTSNAVPELAWLEPGVPSEARWTELAPPEGAGQVRLAHLVRAVRTGAERMLGYDSIAARVVTAPSWTAWTAGAATLRRRIWPGRIGLGVPGDSTTPEVNVAAGGSGAGSGGRPVGPRELRVQLRAPPTLRRSFARGLSALGATVDTSGTNVSAEITLSVGPDPEAWDGLWVAHAGEASAAAALASAPEPDAFLMLDGRTFQGAGRARAGTPAAGTTVSLLRVGGRPAAAARRTGDGCRVVLPLDPRAPIATSADLPLVLESLLDTGCGVLPEPAGADEAFRRLLEDPAAPPTVAVAEIRDAGVGRPLERWLLVLALLVAVAESWTGRRIEGRRHGRNPSGRAS